MIILSRKNLKDSNILLRIVGDSVRREMDKRFTCTHEVTDFREEGLVMTEYCSDCGLREPSLLKKEKDDNTI